METTATFNGTVSPHTGISYARLSQDYRQIESKCRFVIVIYSYWGSRGFAVTKEHMFNTGRFHTCRGSTNLPYVTPIMPAELAVPTFDVLSMDIRTMPNY